MAAVSAVTVHGSLARTDDEAEPAPVRDFAYSLRKLRKCQHLYLAETAERGTGVFAAREFARGDIVMMDFDPNYYDQVLSYRELRAPASISNIRCRWVRISSAYHRAASTIS
jgi:hypothetical protein